ncbi:hypothetical protein PILCRDRAFT_814997 [Piloderma croceum F 1598]|uniref:DUF6593 domain-containing protein n=1 Tax=Piloderma croceum (strain F 1598) TaxID=765440 RepID=A0A0C3FTB5_PILCF|nr:hypothetical protein PILCRDRAFT_814997 [Piloderma croceum F 1598]
MALWLLAQISWRNWEFQPLYVFQPAIIRCFIFQEAVRVQDFLYKRSPYSTSHTRYFRAGKSQTEYRWKVASKRKIADLVLTATSEPSRRLAVFKQRIPGKGVFKGETKNVLIIQPNCPIDLDLVVLSFLIVEKKRRDKDGAEFLTCPHVSENDWDSGMGAEEAGLGAGVGGEA